MLQARSRPRSLTALAALALALPLVAVARADEVRSDEGVAVKLPAGWSRRTDKLGPSNALTLERGSGPGRPTITVNFLSCGEKIAEAQAWKEAGAIVGREGAPDERASGRFCKFQDQELEGASGKLRQRIVAAFRERRLYFFILNAAPETWKESVETFEGVLDGATFFPVVVKEVPLPAPPPAPAVAPVASPDIVIRPRPPEPKPVPPDDFIVRIPDEKKPGKGEAAPVVSPAVTVPNGIRQASATNLLTQASLVAHDSEYDPEIWAAKHLVDGSPTSGWCSAPSARAPHRFILELPRAVDVARITFDDACPEDKGFEGAAAKDVVVEASTLGTRGPWRELVRGSLARGKNGQALDAAPNESRWLRVSIESNHGHPTLTELMEVRVFAAEYVEKAPAGNAPPPRPAATTDEGAFRLERLKLSKERAGAAVSPAVFAPGDTFFVYFKPRAMRLTEKGEYTIEVDLRLEDSQGQEKLSKPKILEHTGTPPKGDLSPYVSLRVELPQDFPTGSFTVKVTARDAVSGREVDDRLAFEVKK